ncbi:GNAT family N-acetyltransferase [Salegentibacter agarivorans]
MKKLLMIEIATWDSNFFKFPVGSFRFKEGADWDLDKFIEEAKEYNLVYIFSETKLDQTSYFKLVDRKVSYSKKLVPLINPDSEIVDYDSKHHDYSDLLDLGYLSGTYSRFKLDDKFTDKEFRSLYKIWIDNSLNGKMAFKVFVKIESDKIAGFVTLQKKDQHTSQIGLIAVNPEFQGRNIASKLIKKCEQASLNYGYKNLEVATQEDNIAAKKLYEKNGFKIKTMEYIYHLWNN